MRLRCGDSEFKELERGRKEGKNSRSDDFTRHTGLCNVDQAFFSESVHLDAELFSQVPNCLLRCESVASDNGSWVNFVLDEIVRSFQEFGSDNDY